MQDLLENREVTLIQSPLGLEVRSGIRAAFRHTPVPVGLALTDEHSEFVSGEDEVWAARQPSTAEPKAKSE